METPGNLSIGLIPLKTIDEIVYADPVRIIRLEAAGKHTNIYVKNDEKIIRSILPISVIETMLPSAFFFKCHRSHIIGLRHLQKLDKCERKIYLADNNSVTISRDLVSEFLQRTDPTYRKEK